MAIAGITGGLGCGKSTVAGIFERRGYRRIDSDALVRERVLVSPGVVSSLRARYGAAVVDDQGVVHRGALAERVFADEAELRWLEELTHPAVFALWRTAFAAEPAAQWVVEVPLLFEKALRIGLISPCASPVLRASNSPDWSNAAFRGCSPGSESPSNCRWREKSSCPILSCGTKAPPTSWRPKSIV